MKRQVADRLFLSGLSFMAIGNAYFEPASLDYMLLRIGGFWANACMLTLLLLTLIAVLDTIVNDMLPERFTWRGPLGRRRGIWMCIAITYAGIAYVITRNGSGYWVAGLYTLCAVRCAGVAFLDLFYEYRPVVMDPATPINPTIPAALGDE